MEEKRPYDDIESHGSLMEVYGCLLYTSGELEIRGIELAHKLFPEVLGKEVELVYADTQSSIYVAETAVADLIDKKPAVVLGSYGDAVSLVASRRLGEAKIPAITVPATNPLITANNEYYFRVSFTDASQGSARCV